MTDEMWFEDPFAAMVRKNAKPGQDILASMTPQKAHLIHMAARGVTEAAELLDAVMKYTIYNKDLDMANVVEELGDMEFCMEGIRSSLSIERDQTLNHCLEKLAKRYPDGYSDKAAQERADKA